MRSVRLLRFVALIFTLAVTLTLAVAQDSAPTPQSQAAPSATPAPNMPQQNQPQPQSQGASVEEQLQLTQDQKERIAAVVDDENKQIDGVRNDNALTLDQKKAKAIEIRQAGVSRMKAVLTPDQLQRLDAIVRERQQNTPQTTPQR